MNTSTITRHDEETMQWLAKCEAYRKAKLEGWDGTTPAGHPLEQWVQKQRRSHKTGRLQDWKRQALREAKFDFVAPRIAAVKTNEKYAHELVAFYLTHGHYAPTQTVGGAGLTKWLAKMRESGGEVGISTEDSASARAALKILKERIPGFRLNGPSKAAINLASGLTFNGFRRKGLCTRSRVWGDHPAIHAAIRYGQQTNELRCNLLASSQKSSTIRSIIELLNRACFFSQAVQVTKKGRGLGWVVDATATGSQISISYELEEHLDPAPVNVITGIVIAAGYNNDGSRYEVNLKCTDGVVRSVGYDALLADQSCLLYLHDLDEPAEQLCVTTTAINWCRWLDGTGGPSRRMSSITTANLHFECSLQKLKLWIEEKDQTVEDSHPHKSPSMHHITWSGEREHYKFIEHLVLKRRTGKLPFSHAERLRGLPVTWGSEKMSLMDIVGHRIEWAFEC